MIVKNKTISNILEQHLNGTDISINKDYVLSKNNNNIDKNLFIEFIKFKQ